MRRFILITTLFFSTLFAFGTSPRHSLGATVSYLSELFPHAYYYRGVGVEATYRYAFVQSRWCELQAIGSLHYTSTHYSAVAFPTDDYRRGYETGITVGLQWNIALYKDFFRAYLGASIGPMYTPTLPARQGGTLNFSDNICLGLHIKLYGGLNLDLRYNYRHLSNAGFSSPNYGLNNHCPSIGLFYKF